MCFEIFLNKKLDQISVGVELQNRMGNLIFRFFSVFL